MVDKLFIPAYSYGNEPVLCAMQWALDTRRIAIVGPSGCGKTTLLHLLAGLLPDVTSPIPAKNAISMMFQEPRLMPWLTVSQNLRLVNPQLSQMDMQHILTDIGLSNNQDTYPKALSGGMQRRVALARAFCIHPDLLLLDEPFVSLDAPTADECRKVLLRLQATNNTQTILVTHDLKEALDLADKVIFLSKRPAQAILTFDVINERKLGKPTSLIMEELLLRYSSLLCGTLT